MIARSIIALALFCGLLSPALADALALEGDFIQGGLVQGRTQPGARVLFDGAPVRVSPEGVFLMGFNRDEPPEAQLAITLRDGETLTRTFEIERREYRIQRIDGLPPSKVTPSEKDLERIYAEYAMARKARKRNDARTDFANGFIWPVTGPISGVYGSQRILNGKKKRPHYGVDVAVPTGTPIVAPADGIVTLAHDDMYFSGGTLILDHGHGLSSSFLHLSKILVAVGEHVKQGDPIAEVGATGRVTGPHLDWRMNLKKRRIDPQLLVEPMPSSEQDS